jgi:hypothetical protein
VEEFIKFQTAVVQWERLRVLVFRELRERTMTPKFKGVASALAKLQHNLDADATKLTARIDSADQRRETVFAKSHASVAAAHAELDGIDDFITELDKTNAGPLDGQGPRSSDLMKE